MDAIIYICQGKTCKYNGSKHLIDLCEQGQFTQVQVKKQYCFGKCGNGCVVFSVPEEKFYTYVTTAKIQKIIDRALNIDIIERENQ